jgi:hypothetical protein
MKRFALLLCLLVLPTTGSAITYKWVDEKGTVGFADDLGNIPKRYRSKAVVVDAAPQPVEVIETPAPQGKEVPKDKADKGVAAPEKLEKKKAVYGGKDEDAWRKDFAKLKADIKANEEHLAEMKGRLADTSKMSRSEYVSLQNSIKDTEIRLNSLRQKLDSLQETADKANVPSELR